MRLPEPEISFREIAPADLASVVGLLSRGFPRQKRATWSRALRHLDNHQQPGGLPKYGYLMERQGTAVGAILTIFSIVRSGDTVAVRCNPCSWYVEPPYRAFAGLLYAKALAHKDVTYLNVSAAPHTEPIIEALGFSRYCDGSFVAVPLLTVRSAATGIKVFDARRRSPEVGFDSGERDLLLQHGRHGCITVWCETPERAYPFVFRRRLARGFLPCVYLVYCGAIEDFVRFAAPIGRYLAARGCFFVVIGSNGPVSGLAGMFMPSILPRYFKGTQQPNLADAAFTEYGVLGT
jgi:hypothetical protein